MGERDTQERHGGMPLSVEGGGSNNSDGDGDGDEVAETTPSNNTEMKIKREKNYH